MVINRIKSLFLRGGGIKPDVMKRLSSLKGEELTDELQSQLYEIAFQNAAKFVHDELVRHESPFRSLQRNLFFNEILVMNFWMMDKVFLKYLDSLAKKMHMHYFGKLSDFDNRAVALSEKMRIYNLCWDEFTGHHDEFGLKAGELLFGKDSEFPVRQVSFWIISYADDSIKSFKKIRKQCLESGLLHKGE